MLQRFGLPEPKAGAKLLRPQSAGAPVIDPMGAKSEIKRETGVIKRVEPVSAPTPALQAEGAVAGKKQGGSAEDVLTDRMQIEAAPPIESMMAKIEAMMEAAGSLEELQQMLSEGFAEIDITDLAAILGRGLLAANAGGRVAVLEDSQ